jgi:glycopeptide antibiotics resistance protein
VRSEAINGLAAIIGGLVIAVLSFVPAAAMHYRRDGRFTRADLLALVVVPVYGLALWTYTLLPLPDPDDVVCQSAILRPLHMIGDVRGVWDGSVLDLVRDPVFLQIVLNVALFVPMGVILRLRYRRGLVWAFAVGLGVSLLIETTQLTGIWGLYDCAYRFFDVDDLLLNTSGALLGSLLALPLAQRLPSDSEQPAPTSPSLGRRVVALVSDLLTMLFVGATAVVVWRIWLVELGDTLPSQVDPTQQALVQWGSALAVEAVPVLLRGVTVGEVVVRMRTEARSRWWLLPQRLVKLVVGVGAVAAFGAWDSPWSSVGLLALAASMLVAAVVTRDHRGLANQVAGLKVHVRAPAFDSTAPPEGSADQRPS